MDTLFTCRNRGCATYPRNWQGDVPILEGKVADAARPELLQLGWLNLVWAFGFWLLAAALPCDQGRTLLEAKQHAEAQEALWRCVLEGAPGSLQLTYDEAGNLVRAGFPHPAPPPAVAAGCA